MRKFTVFYSWQDDLPHGTNLRLIREGLRVASSRLEQDFSVDDLHITIDEDTRDTSGSPSIPTTILQKVREADAFVADITTINKDAPDAQRKVPNPNVMFELGFAMSNLGWNRIVMLFNEAYGKFPDDAPFDIDRQRITRYHLNLSDLKDGKHAEKQITALKKPLFDTLTEALRAIIVHNPRRPDDDLTPEQKKRRHDVTTLEIILSTIHIPTLESHIEEGPHVISQRIFFFWESFRAEVSGRLFHLYDEKLEILVQSIYESWRESLSYDQYTYLLDTISSFFTCPEITSVTQNRRRLGTRLMTPSIAWTRLCQNLSSMFGPITWR